jgi:4-hydroxy-tetrahydrodipicolinate reductase
MTRIAVTGATGRMGMMLIRHIAEAEDLELSVAVEQAGHASIGKDAGVEAGTADAGVTVVDDPRAVGGADVVVDFTFHTAVPATVAAAVESERPIVIGTTGLDEAETRAVHNASSSIPIVWAPNMSLGVNLLFSMVKKAASVLSGYGVEIDETHHVHKKDAPSGTALRLGEKAAEGRGEEFKSVYVHDAGGSGGIRAPGKIVIRSHREGEVVGEHVVAFENEGERVELTHHLRSRDALALGALHAARWIIGRPPGLYDMQTVLDL